MDRKNALIILSLVTLATIVGSTWLIVSGSGQEDDNSLSPECRGPYRPELQLDLTDEQREEIQTRVQAMREAGASREEIRAEITTMLTEWDIELPERPERQGPSQPWMDDLTDEQREEIQTRVQAMREAGVSREEIRAEITAMLTEWGIELPERHGLSPPCGGNRFRFPHPLKASP